LPPELRPPSGGTPPPATASLPDGEVFHLAPAAHEISRRFQAEHPDEQARYGDAAFEWCVHDNQWLLAWAAEDLEIGHGHLKRNVLWLAGVLAARDYPTAKLARDLELAAEVVRGRTAGRRALAERLGAAAKAVPQRGRTPKG
jgi:hypothetical protein